MRSLLSDPYRFVSTGRDDRYLRVRLETFETTSRIDVKQTFRSVTANAGTAPRPDHGHGLPVPGTADAT